MTASHPKSSYCLSSSYTGAAYLDSNVRERKSQAHKWGSAASRCRVSWRSSRLRQIIEGVKTTARVKSPWRRETGMSTLKVP